MGKKEESKSIMSAEEVLPARFFLAADNRTYWTLLVRSSTTGADVLRQLADKLQIADSTLSLSSTVREASGDVMRERIARDALLLPLKKALDQEPADADAKFIVTQRSDADGQILAREVVLTADDQLTANGALSPSPSTK